MQVPSVFCAMHPERAVVERRGPFLYPPMCGHRGANIQAIALPPRPIASMAPRGVDQAEWDKADERGRKRLVQRARG